MYKITKDGVSLGMTEAPNYIRQSEDGCFTLCPERQALGIAFAGGAYQLAGREPMEGTAGDVVLEEVDAGAELGKAAETGGILFVTLAEAGSIDAATAGEHAALFAPWAYPVSYTVGNIRRYKDGQLYQCLQDHTSQADWTPDASPSLWKRVADPAEEWPEWSQPVGALDAYAKGAKVSRNGKHWTSDLDGNVWEPGVYGWTEAAEE